MTQPITNIRWPQARAKRRQSMSAIVRGLTFALTGLAMAGTKSPAHAADPANYPKDGRVTIVVPFAPGGATDIIGRLVAEELGKRWGTAVVVENKAGAGGGIGTELVARAKADGYTLLLGTQTALAVNPTLLKKVPYDVDKDFAPITQLASTPLVLLAGSKSGASTVRELIDTIKAKPDGLTYGTSGKGTSQHLTMLTLLERIGGKAVHVPYKGSSQSLADLAGNQIDMQFDNMTTAIAFAKSGKAKALAVSSPERSPLAPDVPTLAESGVADFAAETWLGLLAPAGTPAPVIDALNREVTAILASKPVQDNLAAKGFVARPMKPDQFRAFIRDETAKFATLIRSNNLNVE